MLFLGKAETLLSYAGLFTAMDSRRRFFRKVPAGSRHAVAEQEGNPGAAPRADFLNIATRIG